MMNFFIAIHVVACIVLITLVLIQRGRGAGLVESFSGVESMFGTKTSVFLTRTTTIMSIVFFITCLGLAVLSVKQSKSLMRNVGGKNAKISPSKVSETPAQPQTVNPAEPATPKITQPETGQANATAEPAVPVQQAAKPDAAKAQ